MSRTMGIGELLRAVSMQKTKQAKIDLLQNNRVPAFASFLQHVFDPNIKFLLPKGDIEYRPAASSIEVNSLTFLSQVRRLYIFREGGNNMISPEQRLAIFKNLLENIDQLDAEACMAMKDKKLPYNIPRKLIEEAYPGFLPPEEKPVKEAKVAEPKAEKLNTAAPTSTSSIS
jgi:hypothetical protein